MNAATAKWRIGARPYRSVYAIAPAGTADVLIGSVQTAAFATLIVAEHNATLHPAADTEGGFSGDGPGGF